MKRGDLVTITMQGNYGKPRPALIFQSDKFSETASVTVLPVTSKLVDAPLFRISIKPDKTNGLKRESQIMVDKAITVKREKIGQTIGKITSEEMLQIERSIAVFLGIA